MQIRNYFIEVKYHKKNHGRLGFGGSGGSGFQPEILTRKPLYFEKNLRWVLGHENVNGYLFLDNDAIREFVSGEVISNKFNNIQLKIFKSQNVLNEIEFIQELKYWLI